MRAAVWRGLAVLAVCAALLGACATDGDGPSVDIVGQSPASNGGSLAAPTQADWIAAANQICVDSAAEGEQRAATEPTTTGDRTDEEILAGFALSRDAMADELGQLEALAAPADGADAITEYLELYGDTVDEWDALLGTGSVSDVNAGIPAFDQQVQDLDAASAALGLDGCAPKALTEAFIDGIMESGFTREQAACITAAILQLAADGVIHDLGAQAGGLSPEVLDQIAERCDLY